MEDVTFTPARAEAITGVTVVQQRDWRRRGFLSRQDGHARFSPRALASMWLLKLLSDRGIALESALGVSEHAAKHILARTLKYDLFVQSIPSELTGTVDELRSLAALAKRCLVWFPSGYFEFGNSVDEMLSVAYSGFDDAKHPAGPLIVFDLEALAVALLRRTGPLFKVNP